MDNIETDNLNSVADVVDDRWSAVWDLNTVFLNEGPYCIPVPLHCVARHVT